MGPFLFFHHRFPEQRAGQSDSESGRLDSIDRGAEGWNKKGMGPAPGRGGTCLPAGSIQKTTPDLGLTSTSFTLPESPGTTSLFVCPPRVYRNPSHLPSPSFSRSPPRGSQTQAKSSLETVLQKSLPGDRR